MDNCNFKLFFLITLVFVVAMNGLPVSSKTVSGAGENPGGFSGNFTDGGSSDNPVQGGCCDVAHPGLNVGGGANDLNTDGGGANDLNTDGGGANDLNTDGGGANDLNTDGGGANDLNTDGGGGRTTIHDNNNDGRTTIHDNNNDGRTTIHDNNNDGRTTIHDNNPGKKTNQENIEPNKAFATNESSPGKIHTERIVPQILHLSIGEVTQISSLDPFHMIEVQVFLNLSNNRAQLVAAQYTERGVEHAVVINLTKVNNIGNGDSVYRAKFGPSLTGTNPFTGQPDTVNSITSLFLRNNDVRDIEFKSDVLGNMTVVT